MMPINILTYVKAGIVAVVIGIAMTIGWYFPHRALAEYKAEVAQLAKDQAQEVESKQKQHNLIVEGIKNEYQSRLALLNRTYVVGVRSPGTSPVLSGSGATFGIDGKPPYDVLINQCAQTTLMLIALQEYETKRLELIHDQQ